MCIKTKLGRAIIKAAFLHTILALGFTAATITITPRAHTHTHTHTLRTIRSAEKGRGDSRAVT